MTTQPAQNYLVGMDVYPQEYEDGTRLYKFYDYLREGRLTTTKCKSCGHIAWPPRLICPECLSDDLEFVDMPKKGKIYSYTVQVGGVPLGFKPPLVLALIDFDNGIRLFSAVVDSNPEDVKIGSEVELSVRKAPPDQLNRERIIPYFTLARSKSQKAS